MARSLVPPLAGGINCSSWATAPVKWREFMKLAKRVHNGQLELVWRRLSEGPAAKGLGGVVWVRQHMRRLSNYVNFAMLLPMLLWMWRLQLQPCREEAPPGNQTPTTARQRTITHNMHQLMLLWDGAPPHPGSQAA